jgi:hypothetical protein
MIKLEHTLFFIFFAVILVVVMIFELDASKQRAEIIRQNKIITQFITHIDGKITKDSILNK